jgi:hypothetical protein
MALSSTDESVEEPPPEVNSARARLVYEPGTPGQREVKSTQSWRFDCPAAASRVGRCNSFTQPQHESAFVLDALLTVNGMMVNVRHLAIEVQEVAYQKGLIPYVPGAKHS